LRPYLTLIYEGEALKEMLIYDYHHISFKKVLLYLRPIKTK